MSSSPAPNIEKANIVLTFLKSRKIATFDIKVFALNIRQRSNVKWRRSLQYSLIGDASMALRPWCDKGPKDGTNLPLHCSALKRELLASDAVLLERKIIKAGKKKGFEAASYQKLRSNVPCNMSISCFSS